MIIFGHIRIETNLMHGTEHYTSPVVMPSWDPETHCLNVLHEEMKDIVKTFITLLCNWISLICCTIVDDKPCVQAV